jgi:hypothetical protein
MFLAKKKFKFYNVLLVSIIIILNIPFRILKLFHYFLMKNNKGLKEGLIFLYYEDLRSVENFKIEVLDGKIYLNCMTVGKICRVILVENPSITKEKFIKGMISMGNKAKIFDNLEKDKERVELNLIRAFDENGNMIFSPHPGYYENFSTIHATSNTIFDIKKCQVVDVAMPSLVLRNATSPGTVITTNVCSIQKSSRSMSAPVSELDAIKYNYPDKFYLNKEKFDRIYTRDKTYEELIKDNKIIFTYKDKKYRVRLLNLSEKEELDTLRRKKFGQLLKDKDILLEKDLIAQYKERTYTGPTT